jgi:hypothetical protein
MPGITYVTSFIPTDNPKRSLYEYRTRFDQLAATGLPFIVFLDISLRWTFPDNVMVFFVDGLKDTWIHKHLPTEVILPSIRGHNDTISYLKVQNTKLHFLRDAAQMNPFQTEWFAWIDFGITHVFRNPEETLNRLCHLSPPENPGMRTAGIWQRFLTYYQDRTCWRFAGGFLLTHVSKIPELCSTFERILLRELPSLKWEVNYWALMESEGVDFGWFQANHDDTIIPNST